MTWPYQLTGSKKSIIYRSILPSFFPHFSLLPSFLRSLISVFLLSPLPSFYSFLHSFPFSFPLFFLPKDPSFPFSHLFLSSVFNYFLPSFLCPLPSFLPSLIPSFLLSLLPSCLPPLLPPLLPSFFLSLLPACFLLLLHPSFLPSFLPAFLPSFFLSLLPACFLLLLHPSFLPSFLSSFFLPLSPFLFFPLPYWALQIQCPSVYLYLSLIHSCLPQREAGDFDASPPPPPVRNQRAIQLSFDFSFLSALLLFCLVLMLLL